jgi:hypothetical protein
MKNIIYPSSFLSFIFSLLDDDHVTNLSQGLVTVDSNVFHHELSSFNPD